MKKWAVWKTILVVISSVVFVGLTTIGGVFLGGGFNRPINYPQTISYVIDESNGNVSFNAQRNQYEASDFVTEENQGGSTRKVTNRYFWMTINGARDDDNVINQTSVTLSLDGSTPMQNGYIQDDVIIIPQTVTLGVPFKVEFRTSTLLDENGFPIFENVNGSQAVVSWTNGGLTTINAQCYSDNELLRLAINVAVDTPVYSVKIDAYNQSGRKLTEYSDATKTSNGEVTLRENITLKANFLPKNSAYLYNDMRYDEQEGIYSQSVADAPKARERMLFYGSDNNITLKQQLFEEDPDSQKLGAYFSANGIGASNISGYAFRYANIQTNQYQSLLESVENDKTFAYTRTLEYLMSAEEAVCGVANLTVKEATVTRFVASTYNISISSGSRYTLSATYTPDTDGNLGAVVYSDDLVLPALLKNIAIAFEYEEGGVYKDAVKDGKITLSGQGQVNTDTSGQECPSITANLDKGQYEGEHTFYFPYAPVDERYCNWTIITNPDEEITVRMLVVLMEDDVESAQKYKVFHTSNGLSGEQAEDIPMVYPMELRTKIHIEEEVSWSTDRIDLVLPSSTSGVQAQELANLDQYVVNPASNVVRDYVYFAVFPSSTGDNGRENAEKMLGASMINSKYNGNYQFSDTGSAVYAYLVEPTLLIYEVGSFDLYFATVRLKTDGSGDDIYPTTGDGDSQVIDFVKASANPLRVTVTKTLHEGSVLTNSLELSSNISDENSLNIYPGMRATAGAGEITLSFNIEEGSVGTFKEKLDNGNISFAIRDKNDQDMSGFFSSISSSMQDDKVTYTLVVGANFPRTEDTIISSIVITDTSTLITENPLSWTLSVTSGKTYTFYTPVPSEITFGAEEGGDGFDFSKTIKVEQKLEETGESVSIQTSKNNFTNTAEFVQELIKYIKVKDQKGAETASIRYDWTFATDNSDVISIRGQEFAFLSTGDQTITAKIWVTAASKTEVRSTGEITLEITSQSVKAVKATTSKKIGTDTMPDSPTDRGLDGVTVEKYAYKSDGSEATITLANIIKVYLDENAITEYKNNIFRFASERLPSGDELLNLFGPNGMLTVVKAGDGEDVYEPASAADTLRIDLAGLDVKAIKVKHNFASQAVLYFNLLDSNGTGAVSVPLTLSLLPSVTLPSSGDYDTSNLLTAVDSDVFENVKLSYKDDENSSIADKNVKELLTGTRYIVTDGTTLENGSVLKCYIVTENEDLTEIGKIENGTIKFADFFDVGVMSRIYDISFAVDGEEMRDNAYSTILTFRATVTNNIKVETIKNQYVFTDSANGDYNNIESFIKISRLQGEEELPDEITYTAGISDKSPKYAKYSSIISIDSTTKKWTFGSRNFTPVFEYGDTSFSVVVTVKVGELTLTDQQQTIEFSSGVSYEEILQRLTMSNSSVESQDGTLATHNEAEIVEYRGISYIKVTQGDWYFDNANYATHTEKPYRFVPTRHYEDQTVGRSYDPNTIGTSQHISGGEEKKNIIYVRFDALNYAFTGLEAEDQYMVIKVMTSQAADDTTGTPTVVMIVPTIVSRLGTYYAWFGQGAQESAAGEYTSNTKADLSDLLAQNADDFVENYAADLIKDGKYFDAKAGTNYVIASSYDTIDNADETKKSARIYYYTKTSANTPMLVSLKFSVARELYYINDKVEEVPYLQKGVVNGEIVPGQSNNGDYILKLNHLVNADQQYQYVVLQVELSSNSNFTAQTLYYIVRVEKDTAAPTTTYPYFASDAQNKTEYITAKVAAQHNIAGDSLDLDKVFDNTTLANGKTRFDIKKLDGTTFDGEDLGVRQTVISLSANYADSIDPAGYVWFTTDNGHQIMQMAFTDTNKYSLKISRTYAHVVGAVAEYSFTINDSSSYSVVTNVDGDERDLVDNETISFSAEQISSAENKPSLMLKLKASYQDGGVQYPPEILQVAWMDGNADNTNYLVNNKFAYNNKQEAVGEIKSNTLVIYTAEYRSQDYTFSLLLYTIYGHILTLNIDIKGSVAYEIDTDHKELTAGEINGYTVTDFYKVLSISGKPNEQIETEKYFTSATITRYKTENDQDYKSGSPDFVKLNDKNLVTYHNNIDTWIEIKFDLTIEEGKTFTFSQIFKINKDINGMATNAGEAKVYQPSDLGGKDPYIAGKQVDIAEKTLVSKLINKEVQEDAQDLGNFYYTWAVDNSNAFNAQNEQQDNVKITLLEIGQRVEATATITVHLKNPETKNQYSSFVIKYKFLVDPAVTITPHYPVPDKKALTSEYLQNGTPIGDTDSAKVGQFFTQSKAMFADESRLTIEDNDKSAEKTELTSDIKIVVSHLENASVEIASNDVSKYTGGQYEAFKYFYIDDGEHDTVYNSKADAHGNGMIFHRGTYDHETKGYNDLGESSYVEFTLTSHGVSEKYRINITAQNPYELTINQDSNARENSKELFYVENLDKSTKILEENRMLSVYLNTAQLNGSITDLIASQYLVLFEKEVEGKYQYQYTTVKFDEKYIGLRMTIDLHEGFPGYEVQGVYRVQDITALTSNEGTLQLVQVEDGQDYYQMTQDGTTGGKFVASPDMQEYTNQLFYQAEKPVLTSRVALTYGGNKVSYDKYAGKLDVTQKVGDGKEEQETTTKINEYVIETGKGTDVDITLSGFKLDDPPLTENTWSTTYTYQLAIDIEVEGAVQFDGNGAVTTMPISELVAYTSQYSLVENAGIKHKSNGATLNRSEFGKDTNKQILLEVIDGSKVSEDSTGKQYAAMRNYITGTLKYPGSNVLASKTNGENGQTYLSISSRSDATDAGAASGASTNYYDYTLQPDGACNDGNYVLLKFTYTVNVKLPSTEVGKDAQPEEFKKEFYIVRKVVPDYVVSYRSRGAQDSKLGEIINNDAAPEEFAPSSASAQDYGTINITSSNGNGVVKVTHKGQDLDLSRNFTYTLKIDDNRLVNDSLVSFNIKKNYENKILPENQKFDIKTAPEHFTSTDEGKTWIGTWVKGDTNIVSFRPKALVMFGDQKYLLEAEDDYGYKFRVAFSLKALTESLPRVNFGGVLVENNRFAIGVANYNKITLEEGEKQGGQGNDTTNINTRLESVQTTTGAGVRALIGIENIESYGYITPLASEDKNKTTDTASGDDSYYKKYFSAEDAFNTSEHRYTGLKNADGTFTANGTKYKFSNGETDYYFAKVPLFLKVRVIQVDFYFNNTNIATVTDGGKHGVLASSDDLYLFNKQEDDRMFYTANGTKNDESTYEMPALPGYVYGGGDQATLRAVIRLGFAENAYQNGWDENKDVTDEKVSEVYELAIENVKVSKSSSVMQTTNKAVRDGEAFEIANYINVTRNKNDSQTTMTLTDKALTKDDKTKYALYDDTLQVLVPNGSSVNLTIDFKDQDVFGTEDAVRYQYTLRNTSLSYPQLQYVSLSAIAGKTLSKDTKFTVNVSVNRVNIVENTKLDPNIRIWYNGIELTPTSRDNVAMGSLVKFGNDENSMEQIHKDKINVEDSRVLAGSNNNTNTDQFYLISMLEADDEEDTAELSESPAKTVEYRLKVNYNVTGYFYDLNRNYLDNYKMIDGYITEKGTDTRYIIPLTAWTDGMFLTKGDSTQGRLQGIDDNSFADVTNKVYFEIQTTDNNGVPSGAASIDDNGTITTNKDFDIDYHFITVSIRQKVSGVDGDWNTKSNDDIDLSTAGRNTSVGSFNFKLVNHGNDQGIALNQLTGSNSNGVVSGSGNLYKISTHQRVMTEGTFEYSDIDTSFTSDVGNDKLFIYPQALKFVAGQAVDETDKTGDVDDVKIDNISFIRDSGKFSLNKQSYILPAEAPLMVFTYTPQAGFINNTPTGTIQNIDTADGHTYCELLCDGDTTYIVRDDAFEGDKQIGTEVTILAGHQQYTRQLVQAESLTLGRKVTFSGESKVTYKTGTDTNTVDIIPYTFNGRQYYIELKADSYTLANATFMQGYDKIKFKDTQSETQKIGDTSYTLVKVNNIFFITDESGIIYTILSNFGIASIVQSTPQSPDYQADFF